MKLPVDDKYRYYGLAVQSPATDAEFFRDVYKELGRDPKKPLALREDFCGTFEVCCEWVKLNKKYSALGVDLDPEPIDYGFRIHHKNLNPSQRERVRIEVGNVLDPRWPPADIVVALNFSYFLFHSRQDLLAYFIRVRKSLKQGGLFLLDVFGGKLCHGPYTDRIAHKNFTYYWDQKNHDPVTHRAQFSINFRLGRKMYKDVFTYDWRMWGIAELRDLLADAGFGNTHIYWEGSTRSGQGNGIFKRVIEGEECLSWVAYIAAEGPRRK